MDTRSKSLQPCFKLSPQCGHAAVTAAGRPPPPLAARFSGSFLQNAVGTSFKGSDDHV
jgi:hypothetical protein